MKWSDISPGAILEICDYLEGDGHGLYDSSLLLGMNIPAELVDPLTKTHKAGRGKYQLFDREGAPVSELTAVYSLDLYRAMAKDLGVSPSRMLGRGSEARDYDFRIRQLLESDDDIRNVS